MSSTHTFPDNSGLANNLHNNLFLPGFSSSPGWFPVTRTRGAWCRFRGYWRSRPRHLSPRSKICAQEWHCKDIHSHTIPIHPCTLLKKEKKKSKTFKWPNMMPSFTGPLPVQCACGRRPGSLAPALRDCSTSEAFSPRTVLTENICRCVQHILLVNCFVFFPFVFVSNFIVGGGGGVFFLGGSGGIGFFFFLWTSVACRPMTSLLLLLKSLPFLFSFSFFPPVVIHRFSSLVRLCVRVWRGGTRLTPHTYMSNEAWCWEHS